MFLCYCSIINPHILQTVVTKVQKADNFEENGQWIVTTKGLSDQKEMREKYDFVLVCNGHLTEPNKPHVPGLEKFQGKVLHTHDYKDFRGFEDKRILVIGIGNSAADVACELSRHASHVSIKFVQYLFENPYLP